MIYRILKKQKTGSNTSRVSKNLLTLLCFLPLQINLAALDSPRSSSLDSHDEKVILTAQKILSEDLPGRPDFKKALSKGATFELETAEMFKTKGEKIEGLNLKLQFMEKFSPKKTHAFPYKRGMIIPGTKKHLEQIEFDVVTDLCVTECKCGHLLNKQLLSEINEQLEKQSIILAWLKKVAHDKNLEWKVYGFHAKYLWFEIHGDSTNGKTILMKASWFKHISDPDKFAAAWINLIKSFAYKAHMFVARQQIPAELKETLDIRNIKFFENVFFKIDEDDLPETPRSSASDSCGSFLESSGDWGATAFPEDLLEGEALDEWIDSI